MTNPAIKGSGAQLSVATAAATALNVTAATQASPVVLTVTNTYVAGDIIVTDGSFLGMTDLNTRAFVALAPTSSAVSLKGIDGTGFGAYVSGGTVTKQTMQLIGKVQNITGFDGTSTEIDITHLLSSAKEFLLGLQDFGQVTFTALQQTADVGQVKLRAIKRSQTLTAFSLALSDGSVAAFMAYCKGYSFGDVKPDGAVINSVTLRVSGEPAFFA